MKIRITRYPNNNETRVAVFPERFPKSLDQICSGSGITTWEGESLENSSPVKGSDSLDSSGGSPFNIKSKVDTRNRPRRMSLSRYGRNTVLRAGSCFDNDPGSERLLLTGTLPGRLTEAFRALACFSTVATKTLCNWLTRRHPGAKWLYCWEWQKRGALHLHLVVEVPIAIAEYVKAHFKDEWNAILRKISHLSGVNLFKRTHKYIHSEKVTQADVTVCDREPSRYVSKYISKGNTNGFDQKRFPPSTWYQVSRSLLKSLRASIETYESSGVSYGQARAFIENATHCVSQGIQFGGRYFDGAILAWSGYSYDQHFDIEEWGKIMNTKQRNAMAITTMYMIACRELTVNTNARCYLRARNEMVTDIEKPLSKLTEGEMKKLILRVMQAVSVTWEYCNTKNISAQFFMSAVNWWELVYDECPLNEFAVLEIFTFCNESLTGDLLRTKV